MKAAFSTGSQNQNPPQPKMVYAHHEPSNNPEANSTQAMIPHTLPASTHSSPDCPANNDPTAKAKGTVMQISPAIKAGGWKNIPKWVRSGFMPSPSQRDEW
ncbi:MAG: hypothetical protein CM1200mP27_01600 [Chloroflexota bacterium]|nr:MAG: hypothetical protein CM1200mP27_01600 [Chloroflexota bacterium]